MLKIFPIRFQVAGKLFRIIYIMGFNLRRDENPPHSEAKVMNYIYIIYIYVVKRYTNIQ